MTTRLAGKRALVTGAGSGIGEAIALRFAAEGAVVAVTDIDLQTASAVADRIRAAGGEASAHPLDVCDDRGVEALAAEMRIELEGLDVVVSNVGGTLGQYPPVLDADIAYWDRLMGLNLRATFVVCRSFVPLMVQSGGGSLITVASLGALTHRRGFGLYSTAKSAVIRLTQAIATDYGDQGIRANVICPGMTETPAIARLLARAKDETSERDRHASEVPLGRLGRPDDIASSALFLASDEASFVTGTVNVVDGGTLIAPG